MNRRAADGRRRGRVMAGDAAGAFAHPLDPAPHDFASPRRGSSLCSGACPVRARHGAVASALPRGCGERPSSSGRRRWPHHLSVARRL
jgi:hypothetical protein